MESTTNQSNASKESEMGSDQDTAECCKEVDIVTRVGEIDEMVENSTGRTLIEYEGPANCDPYVGMEFESEEATKMFYNEYGRSVGFTIRVNTTRRSRRDGTIIGREFVCSKEGFRRKKYQSNRPHTREGCKAMIKVKKGESGKWVVTKFVKDHNHVLGTSRKVSVLRSSRHASDATKNPTITFDGARIAPPRIMSALIEQSGGSNSIGFALQECTNFTQSVQKRTLQREAQMGALPLHGLSDTVVGVLGRGQLGRMFCHAASCMGIKVLTLNPLNNCTSSEVSSNHMVGSFDDGDSVQEFAKKCGVLTVETEHVNVATLERLEQHGVDCQPKASTIRLTQDKYLQKFHFSQYPIPVPSFMQIDNLQSAEKAGELFGFPLMVKRRRFTHNGRRNAVAYSKGELPSAVSALGGYEQGLYAEKFAPFVKELAVLVARGRDNSVVCFPVVETIQKDNVCHIIEAPADVPEKIRKLAVDVAQRTVSSLEGAGIFAVELFLMRDDQILLNEVAPRPHNSGHHTIESCYTSQYEQHLRAITGLPLGDPSMKTSAAVMYNLLGEEGKEGFHLAHQLMKRALSIPGATVHWYEKPEMGKRRKLSHITIVGPSRSIVKARLDLMLNSENVAADTTVLPRVAIIMSSDSNLPVMKVAGEILKTFDVPFEISIVSAHQTPERMFSFASCAQERGIQVIIAADGGAAHLPGMVASLTPVPVIGVPIRASLLDGVDALLSIVQMPKGIPVATVSIGNATNAALLAIRILAVADSDLQRRMIQYQADMKETLLRKVEKLDREGWEKYSDS